ncbi:MAG: GxxExxY protein [Gemmatimonadaceae bacterium]
MRPGEELIWKEKTRQIIGAFFEVYNTLRYGHLESVYRRALYYELTDTGIPCEEEVLLSVIYKGRNVGDFRADLIIDNTIVVEVKTGSAIHHNHVLQLANYLKSTSMEVGLVLNFGPKPTFERFVLSRLMNQSA